MNLKLIYNEVADIETSQEAADLGLEIKTVCSWRIYNRLLPGSKGNELVSIIGDITGSPHFTSFETAGNCVAAENDTFISAPLATEIPLPKERHGIDGSIEYAHSCIYFLGKGWDEYQEMYTWVRLYDCYFDERHTCSDWLDTAVNEATARLKMAIWLIKNIPKARQWYIDNGYLQVAA